MPYRLYLCLVHSIPSPMLMQQCTNLDQQMIWSTSYHHMTLLVHQSWLHLLFTLLPSSISAKSCSSFTIMRSFAPKPPTCPSRLQPIRQAKPCFDLLHLSHMTPCRVSYAMSSFITCVSFATSLSHFYLHGICCSYTCTCGLITYVSHINTISPPRLSLNYQNQTRTFHPGLPHVQVGLRCAFQQASLGPLPVVFTIKLLAKMPRALFPSVHGGGHITNAVGMVSQDYKPHRVQTRCVQAPWV